MTISILLNTSWNIYNFRLGLIKALQREGHKIIAIAPYDEFVSLLKGEGVDCHNINLNSNGTNIREDLRLISEYYILLKAIKPDLILSYTIKPNIYGNLAAGILGIKVINNVSGLGTVFIKKSFSTYIAMMLYKIAFFKSDWVFFQNNEDQNIFLQKKLQKEDKTSVLPGSGVNLRHFKYDRLENKGKTILFVGRLIGDKGIREFFIAAKTLIKKYPDLVFKVAGELGNHNSASVSESELDEWLKFPQFQYLGKSNNMNEILKEVDIMVLPSYREGLSKSLIEACAMELPIVTTDVPGCKEVVNDTANGYLCKVRDPYDLANKIEKLIRANENDRIKMGKNGRKRAENEFDEKIVIKRYIERINMLSIS